MTTATIDGANPLRLSWSPSTVTKYGLTGYTQLTYPHPGEMGTLVTLDQTFDTLTIRNLANGTYYGSFLIDPPVETYPPGPGILGAWTLGPLGSIEFTGVAYTLMRIFRPSGAGTLELILERTDARS